MIEFLRKTPSDFNYDNEMFLKLVDSLTLPSAWTDWNTIPEEGNINISPCTKMKRAIIDTKFIHRSSSYGFQNVSKLKQALKNPSLIQPKNIAQDPIDELYNDKILKPYY